MGDINPHTLNYFNWVILNKISANPNDKICLFLSFILQRNTQFLNVCVETTLFSKTFTSMV